MRETQMSELANEALRESKRNDCQIASVKPRQDSASEWWVDLVDQNGQPFRVVVNIVLLSEEEIKEAIRRGIAEYFSAASY